MTIADAFKEFFNILNGVKPSGTTIAEVVRNGTSSVQRNNESALATRMTTAEGEIDALQALNPVEYEEGEKSFVLKSSTADSVKEFRVTVDDTGALTATEIVEAEAT